MLTNDEMIAEKLEALEGRIKTLESQRLPRVITDEGTRLKQRDVERMSVADNAGKAVVTFHNPCPHEALIMKMAERLGES